MSAALPRSRLLVASILLPRLPSPCDAETATDGARDDRHCRRLRGNGRIAPAGIAGAFGSVGISGTGVFARALGGAAKPLFIASAILLIAEALACSRLVAALVSIGGLLLYLSMFELAHGGGAGSGSMSVMAMNHTHGTARAEPITFYAGLGALLLSITLQIVRRRRGTCRPVLRLRRAT